MKRKNYFLLSIVGTFLVLAFVVCSVHAAPPQSQVGWYLKLVAQTPAGDLRDANNVLGQLIDSVEGYDNHDLPELTPFTAPYLTIIFPHDDWVGHEDNYNSDYHALNWKQADQWDFQVSSDNPSLDVNLYWGDVQVVDPDNVSRAFTDKRYLDNMYLEDVDTGELIKIVENGVSAVSYSFNMDGKTVRNFRWILDGKEEKVK